jgi:hypothetical protein
MITKLLLIGLLQIFLITCFGCSTTHKVTTPTSLVVSSTSIEKVFSNTSSVTEDKESVTMPLIAVKASSPEPLEVIRPKELLIKDSYSVRTYFTSLEDNTTTTNAIKESKTVNSNKVKVASPSTYVKELEQQKLEYEWGTIVYEVPLLMKVGKKFELTVSIDKGVKLITAQQQPNKDKIKVYALMAVHLFATDGEFDVIPLSDEQQVIDGSAQWKFAVIPRKLGLKRLHFKVCARLKLNDKDLETINFPIVDKDITVRISIWYYVLKVLSYWQTWLGIITGSGIFSILVKKFFDSTTTPPPPPAPLVTTPDQKAE